MITCEMQELMFPFYIILEKKKEERKLNEIFLTKKIETK